MPSAPAPRRAVTGRALVLGTLVVLLLVLLASPLHRYFASRSDVAHAAQQLREDQQQQSSLSQQLQRWSDPGYVQQQARIRLQFAMPGDTVYVVVSPGQKNDIRASSGSNLDQEVGSWNQRLWGSVQAAGR